MSSMGPTSKHQRHFLNSLLPLECPSRDNHSAQAFSCGFHQLVILRSGALANGLIPILISGSCSIEIPGELSTSGINTDSTIKTESALPSPRERAFAATDFGVRTCERRRTTSLKDAF
jgi:hypothetical protein